MITNYFGKIKFVPFEQFPGIYASTDHRDQDSSRFICTYSNGQKNKEAFFQLLERTGQIENRAHWDLHHIVEGHHYADIDFKGQLRLLYDHHLPCVLIHNKEHQLYTKMARLGAARELFFASGLSKQMTDRSAQVAKEAQDPKNKPLLLARLRKMERFYDELYLGDPVLHEVSRMVLREAAIKI